MCPDAAKVTVPRKTGGMMQTEALFWGIAILLVLGSLGLVFAPLLRGAGRAGRRSSYDMRIYRDQLREIEADLARGTVTQSEAAASRLEISRRLLAAADSETGEKAAVTAPRGLSRLTVACLGLVVAAATAGLYAQLGAPGDPDLPLSLRLEQEAKARANRPSQAEAEALIAGKPKSPGAQAPRPEDLALVQKLQDVLKTRPDDLRGHVLLVRSLGALGRWQEARVAQGDVVRIEGDKVTAPDLVTWAELMVLAANGYVSPEAESALAHALTLDPGNPLGRYYSGLTLLQGGRPDLAYGLWSRLLAEGPADAPWIPTIKAQIGDVASLAGMPPPEEIAGPDQAQVDAAGAMTPEQRQTMIEGMVNQLRTRLSTQGGTAAEWSQLIRAYGVQGRMDDAAKAWTDAKAAHATDPAALAALTAAARDAGLIN